jgi:hypothetical protein
LKPRFNGAVARCLFPVGNVAPRDLARILNCRQHHGHDDCDRRHDAPSRDYPPHATATFRGRESGRDRATRPRDGRDDRTAEISRPLWKIVRATGSESSGNLCDIRNVLPCGRSAGLGKDCFRCNPLVSRKLAEGICREERLTVFEVRITFAVIVVGGHVVLS